MTVGIKDVDRFKTFSPDRPDQQLTFITGIYDCRFTGLNAGNKIGVYPVGSDDDPPDLNLCLCRHYILLPSFEFTHPPAVHH